MLKRKHMKLDAVIEFKVDESALLSRIQKRAAETVAAGGIVRPDDNPEFSAPGSTPIGSRRRPCRSISGKPASCGPSTA